LVVSGGEKYFDEKIDVISDGEHVADI